MSDNRLLRKLVGVCVINAIPVTNVVLSHMLAYRVPNSMGVNKLHSGVESSVVG